MFAKQGGGNYTRNTKLNAICMFYLDVLLNIVVLEVRKSVTKRKTRNVSFTEIYNTDTSTRINTVAKH